MNSEVKQGKARGVVDGLLIGRIPLHCTTR